MYIIEAFFSFACVAVPCLLGTSLHSGKAFGIETKQTSLPPCTRINCNFCSSFNLQMWEMGLTGVERVENGLKGRVV